MRGLRFTLASIYPILIILLLLLKNCGRPSGTTTNDDDDGEVISDTTAIVVENRPDTTTIRKVRDVGGIGELKVTLLWNFQGDIDLHVRQPNGRTIFYDNKYDSATGGNLDYDNQVGGRNSAENIYWEHPPKGQYTISLEYYKASHNTGIAESGICTVVVMQKGMQAKEYKVSMDRVKERKRVTILTIQ